MKDDIADIFRDSEMDPEVRDEVQKELDSRRIVRQLVSMRARAGLSQLQVSERMGCSQGRISKLEHSKDDDLTLGDIKAYAKAVNSTFQSGVVPHGLTPVEHLKLHVLAIHRHMKSMAKLAPADKDLAKRVTHFFGEVFFNMSRLVGDTAGELPRQEDGTLLVEFTFIEDLKAEDEPIDAESGMYLHS